MLIKEKLSANQRRALYKVLDILPDTAVIRLQYFASLGRWPNLKNPKRFTEQMMWYKINYRTPLMTQCADKYRVREYIEKKGFGEHLPKLYQVVDDYKDILFEELPEAFAIKCNNGSGTNIFVRDKKSINLDEINATMSQWTKVNTISVGREWAYENIEQKIVVEELLVADDKQQEKDLNDYKVLCFNGKPYCVWVDVGRHYDHRRNFYDLEWKLLDVESDCPLADFDIPKPVGFDQMIEIASNISQDFPFVRVDFYSLNGKIYVGELTFYPWSGCVQFKPDSFDYELGSQFTLPKKTRC